MATKIIGNPRFDVQLATGDAGSGGVDPDSLKKEGTDGSPFKASIFQDVTDVQWSTKNIPGFIILVTYDYGTIHPSVSIEDGDAIYANNVHVPSPPKQTQAAAMENVTIPSFQTSSFFLVNVKKFKPGITKLVISGVGRGGISSQLFFSPGDHVAGSLGPDNFTPLGTIFPDGSQLFSIQYSAGAGGTFGPGMGNRGTQAPITFNDDHSSTGIAWSPTNDITYYETVCNVNIYNGQVEVYPEDNFASINSPLVWPSKKTKTGSTFHLPVAGNSFWPKDGNPKCKIISPPSIGPDGIERKSKLRIQTHQRPIPPNSGANLGELVYTLDKNTMKDDKYLGSVYDDWFSQYTADQGGAFPQDLNAYKRIQCVGIP